MSEYKKYFEAYCREHDLELRLSFEMPFLSKFVVLLELVRPDDIAVHRFNSRRASSTSE